MRPKHGLDAPVASGGAAGSEVIGGDGLAIMLTDEGAEDRPPFRPGVFDVQGFHSRAFDALQG